MYTKKLTIILVALSDCKIKLNWKENNINKILTNINLMWHNLGLMETKNQLLTIKISSQLLLPMFSWVAIPRVNIVVTGAIVHNLQYIWKSLLSLFQYSTEFILLDASSKAVESQFRACDASLRNFTCVLRLLDASKKWGWGEGRVFGQRKKVSSLQAFHLHQFSRRITSPKCSSYCEKRPPFLSMAHLPVPSTLALWSCQASPLNNPILPDKPHNPRTRTPQDTNPEVNINILKMHSNASHSCIFCP